MLVSFACVLFVECFARLPVWEVARRLLSLNRRAAMTLGRLGVSEHWKERAIGCYAIRTLRVTLHLTLLFSLIFIGLVVFGVVSEAFAPGFVEFATRPIGISVSLLVTIAYSPLRPRFVRAIL